MYRREAIMTEDRLVDIESKLAHQEYLLAELNDVITKQQENIMRLESLCDSLAQRMRSISDALPADTPLDEKPPHY